MKNLTLTLSILLLVGAGLGRAQSVSLSWGDTLFVAPGDTFSLVLRADGFQSVASFQLSLAWDEADLQFERTEEEALSGLTINAGATGATLAWINSAGGGLDLPGGSALLRLVFQARQRGDLPAWTTVEVEEAPLRPLFFQLADDRLIEAEAAAAAGLIVIRACTERLDLGPDRPLCPGDTLLLAPERPQQWLSLTWMDSLAAGRRRVHSPGWWSAVAEASLRCKSVDSIWIRSADLPVYEWSTTATLCEGETIGIGPDLTEGYKYRWSTGDTSAIALIEEPGTYRLTVTNEDGCRGRDSVAVTLVSFPVASLRVSRDTICPGETVMLSFSGPAGFVWQDTSGRLEPAPGGQAYIKLWSSTRIAAIFDNECFTGETGRIVHVRSTKGDAGEDIEIDAGGIVRLRATGGVRYQWSGPDIIRGGQAAEVEAAPREDARYVVFIEDENGCTTTDSVLVSVRFPESIYVPDAFSPNGDGRNDRFTLYAGAAVRRVRYLRVFSRWGELLFERKDFEPGQADQGWDGAHRGRPLNMGVYLYAAEVEMADRRREAVRGVVRLIR